MISAFRGLAYVALAVVVVGGLYWLSEARTDQERVLSVVATVFSMAGLCGLITVIAIHDRLIRIDDALRRQAEALEKSLRATMS